MKCELLAEQNLPMMLDFVDDENTKYDGLSNGKPEILSCWMKHTEARDTEPNA